MKLFRLATVSWLFRPLPASSRRTVATAIVLGVFVIIRLASPALAEPPSIFLVTIDTLRADHLGSYGYERDTSPNLDKLAESGTIFTNARVTMPKTTPSLVSIVSGLYPRTHRIFELRVKISESIETLPELLSKAGYHTIGVCGQFNCSGKLGFARGFKVYDDDFESYRSFETAAAERGSAERSAEEIVSRALTYLEERPAGKPVFVWVHLMDPHAAYSPPAPYNEHFKGRAPVQRGSWFDDTLPLERIHPRAREEGKLSFDYYVNRYDGEIRYMDAQLGRLFERVEADGLSERSVFVVTADHGEYMGEYSDAVDLFSHGFTLYESEVRAPLIVKMPGDASREKAIDAPVSLTDIFPTILSAAGLPERPSEGVNLVPFMNGRAKPDPDRLIVVQLPNDTRTAYAVVSGGLKLVTGIDRPVVEQEQAIKDGKGTYKRDYEQLLALGEASETRESLRVDGEASGMLRKRLAAWIAEAKPVQPPEALGDSKSLEQIRSLGYLN